VPSTVLNFDDFEEMVVGPFSLPRSTSKFVLKEPSAAGKATFRDAQLACVTSRDEDKLYFGAGIAKTELVLVRECLFEVLESGEHRPVSKEFVEGLPDRVTSKLYDAIKEMEKVDPKASSIVTTDGSE